MYILVNKYTINHLVDDAGPKKEMAADRAIENDPEARYVIPWVPPGKNDAM